MFSSPGCRKEMLRAKQVGQVLRALVDFASKHAVFEAGNRNHRTEPRNQVWLDMGPSRAKIEVFFFSHICLFNDDLICIFFVDPQKNLGEFVHFSEFAGDKQAGKAAGLKRVKRTLVVLQNSDFLTVQPIQLLLGGSSHLSQYLESPPFIRHVLAIWKVEKTRPGIGGLTNIIMVKWANLGDSTAQRAAGSGGVSR